PRSRTSASGWPEWAYRRGSSHQGRVYVLARKHGSLRALCEGFTDGPRLGVIVGGYSSSTRPVASGVHSHGCGEQSWQASPLVLAVCGASSLWSSLGRYPSSHASRRCC